MWVCDCHNNALALLTHLFAVALFSRVHSPPPLLACFLFCLFGSLFCFVASSSLFPLLCFPFAAGCPCLFCSGLFVVCFVLCFLCFWCFLCLPCLLCLWDLVPRCFVMHGLFQFIASRCGSARRGLVRLSGYCSSVWERSTRPRPTFRRHGISPWRDARLVFHS